jgi:hypothetical protein
MATTHAPVITLEALVDRLIDLPPAEGAFLSVYLDGRPDEHGRGQVDPFLRKELRARRRALDLPHAQLAAYDEDVRRVLEWTSDVLPRSANGAAVFACAPAGVFEAVALDAPIEGHQVLIGPRPRLYPLLRVMDRYRRYAAVVADTQATRIFVFGLNTTVAARELEGERRPRAGDLEGASNVESRYQRHVAEHAKQNMKEAAAVLDAIVRTERPEAVILAGDDVALPLLRAALTPDVAARVVEQMHLDIRAPEHEVMRATLEAFRRYDARTDADKVRQATDAYRAGGLGVAGAGAAWMALQIGQVDELLVPADPSLLRVTDDDIALAGEEAVRLTVEELATQARRTDARVSVIEDAGLLRDVGGVAGLLRYRVTPRWQGPIPT